MGDSPGLRSQTIGAAKWSALTTVSVVVVRMARSIVLARILALELFGLVAMVTLVVGFTQVFADAGVSGAIIYERGVTRREFSTLFWLQILIALGIFVLLTAATPLIVAFWSEPALRPIVPLLAFGPVITAIGSQMRVRFTKELMFQRLGVATISGSMAGLVAALVIAYLGGGVYAIVFASLISNGVTVVLAWILAPPDWRPMLTFKISEASRFIKFGMYQMGQRGVNYFSGNLDYLIVGKMLGKESLAIYQLAYSLVTMPLQRLNPLVNSVAFPAFARRQDNLKTLQKAYLELQKLLGFVSFPLIIGLAAAAPAFVVAVYGPKWSGAIPLIQILCVVALMKGVSNPLGSILLARGRPDVGFKWNVFVVGALCPVLYFGARQGVMAMVICYAVFSLVLFAIWHGPVQKRVLGVEWKSLGKSLFSPLAGAVTVLGFVWVIEGTLMASPLMRLTIEVLVSGFVYLLFFIVFDRPFLRYVLALIRNKRKV